MQTGTRAREIFFCFASGATFIACCSVISIAKALLFLVIVVRLKCISTDKIDLRSAREKYRRYFSHVWFSGDFSSRCVAFLCALLILFREAVIARCRSRTTGSASPAFIFLHRIVFPARRTNKIKMCADFMCSVGAKSRRIRF